MTRGLSAFALASLIAGAASAQAPVPPGTTQAPGTTLANAPADNLPSAGGLTAPGPLHEVQATPSNETEAALKDSVEDDSGRSLSWFWLDVDGGFQHVGLETFGVDKSNLTAGFVSSEANGSYVSAGLGLQLLFLRVGPRARVGFFEDWQLFSVGGEVSLRFPLGFLEPHIDLGGGYTALGSLSTGGLAALSKSARVEGGYGRIGGGLDIFIGDAFSIGPYASWEVMGLKRPGVALADLDPTHVSSLTDAQKTAAAIDGSGYGSTLTAGARVGLSF